MDDRSNQGTEMVGTETSAPRDGAPQMTGRTVWLCGFLLVLLLAGCGGGSAPIPAPPPSYTASSTSGGELQREIDTYRLSVYDEVLLTVLGSPDLSGTTRVLPDGSLTIPGVGPIFVLGSTVPEVTAKVEESLGSILRFPQASVAVSNFGARRIFVMGEVGIPGDHEYHRGMTALGAVAQAGGFNNNAKRSSVIVLRRLGPNEAIAYRVDLRGPLKGKDLDKDLPVRPFDVIYVPKTFIASVNVLMDQYVRQMTPPFTLYIEGWNAFNIDETNVRFLPR